MHKYEELSANWIVSMIKIIWWNLLWWYDSSHCTGVFGNRYQMGSCDPTKVVVRSMYRTCRNRILKCSRQLNYFSTSRPNKYISILPWELMLTYILVLDFILRDQSNNVAGKNCLPMPPTIYCSRTCRQQQADLCNYILCWKDIDSFPGS
jgi:hypothetical protein